MIAFIAFLIGIRLSKISPNSTWYAHFAIQFYVVGNILDAYYLGLYSVVAGVAMGAGPILGLILFPGRIIYPAILLGSLITPIVYFLTTIKFIPYAPVLDGEQEIKFHSSWLFLVSLLAIPHLMVAIISTGACIIHWRTREKLSLIHI